MLHLQNLMAMKGRVTKVDTKDNLIVALTDLEAGSTIQYNGEEYILPGRIPAKHKFVTKDMEAGEELFMYGVLVGKPVTFIPRGGLVNVFNVKHAAGFYTIGERKTNWHIPDISKFKDKTFMGFHRQDGKVGTANYWLVVPLVFCENRNGE